MAEPRIYQASSASIVAVTGQGVAVPLGLVFNLRMEKMYEVEAVREWGNYANAALLLHGYSGRFSWGKAWSPGVDLVGQGLLPSDAEIAQFQPFILRVIDQISQRQIAEIRRALAETVSVGADARAKLMQDVSGQCISILFESEL